MTAAPTPSQTIGPFFRFGMAWLHGRQLVGPEVPDAITLRGRLFDGAGEAVPDAVVEVFQEGPTRFGRALTDDAGGYEFVTAKPGWAGRGQAPHLDISLFARGLLQRCWTRCYFPDEAEANAADPLLRTVSDPERVATLVAVPEGPTLRFDIRLQGARETVFLDW
jgi:protocatechuate 3,4-dioxygenase alpha subunit